MIGFITPVSKPFCAYCNRLRLTSDGYLKACLLSTKSIDLKPILRGSDGNLEQAFRRVMLFKPKVHEKEELVAMSRVGG